MSYNDNDGTELVLVRNSLMKSFDLTEEDAEEVIDLLINPDRTDDFTDALADTLDNMDGADDESS